MGTIINTNVQALNSQRALKVVSETTGKASEKLSSGMRINRAGDDAAGLAISEKMRGQIRGLNQGSRNAQDGISLIQTAEGALQESHEMLQRMRELVVQGSNDTNTSTDRSKIATELSQLVLEISATASKTQFNKISLLNLGGTTGLHIHAGANGSATAENSLGQGLSIVLSNFGAAQLGVSGVPDNMKGTGGGSAIAGDLSTIDKAIEGVSTFRAKLGAWQNRLEHTVKNLDTSSENLSAAESRIRDTDMAKEMMNFTKSNVLSQAAQSMLAQANQAPNQILSLLR